MRALLFAALFLVACGGAQKKSNNATDIPLGDPALAILGTKIAESLNNGTEYFNQVFDTYELARRTVPNADMKFIQGFVAGMEDTEGGLAGRFQNRSFRFLNVIGYDGKTYVLLRSLTGRGGFNYEAFEVSRGEKENYRVVDVLFFASGESFSGLMQELGVSPAHVSEQHIADLNAAHAFKIATNQNREDAVKNWEALPAWLRELQSMRNFYVSVLATSNHLDVYEKEFKAYERDFPDHPSLLFMKIDYDFLSGRFDQMNTTLDTLEERFSRRDPYLDVLRANALFKQHRYTEALAMTDRALSEEPQLQEAWESSLDYALAAKDFGRAANIMSTLSSKFGLQWSLESIQTEPVFAEFAASPEGKDFLSKLSSFH